MGKIYRISLIIGLFFGLLPVSLKVMAIDDLPVVAYDLVTYDLSKIEDANLLFSIHPELYILPTNAVDNVDNYLNPYINYNLINPLYIVTIDEGGGECYGTKSNFNLSICVKANYSNVSIEYDRLFNRCYDPFFDNVIACASYAIFGAGNYFVQKVRSGGAWDYKTLFPSYNTQVIIRIDNKDYSIQAQDIGNIHYGYVGSALFAPVILKSFAGLANALDNKINLSWVSTYFDDPADQLAIQRGINWRNNGYFK